jgi:pSer/pThr/pTyr-binding forkhead associated (FHA) protein
MKIETFFIFLGVFITLTIIYFALKWLSKRKDISEVDLTTAIEDIELPIEETDLTVREEILGELDLVIRDKEISTIKISEQEISIGRDPTHSTLIISEPTISKVHCHIYTRDNKIFIKDNDSTNGTFVNNNKIVESELKSTDVIFLGKKGTVKLIFRKANQQSG